MSPNAHIVIGFIIIAVCAIFACVGTIMVKNGFDMKSKKLLEEKVDDIAKQLTLIANALAVSTGKWETVDLSQAVPPVTSSAAFLIFRSKTGIVKGFIKGEGFDEQHPFDTSINNTIPVAVEIKEPKIKYLITFPKNKTEELEILVAGFRINR